MNALKRNTKDEYSSTQIFSLIGAIAGAVVIALPSLEIYLPEEIYGAMMMIASAIVSVIRKRQTTL